MQNRKKNILIGVLLSGVLGMGYANAATFTVTKTQDSNDGVCDGDCSLREAIFAANNQAGADIINVPAGTYQLTILGADEDGNATGDLDVNDDLTINGAGPDQTIIDGNTIDRVVDIDFGVNAELNDLAIVNGVIFFEGGSGGGIYNAGNTTLNNLHFEGNVSDFGGGAIESRPVPDTNGLTVNSSTFVGNCAGYGGGAIDSGGKITVTDSIFDGNIPMSKAGIDCLNDLGGGAMHVSSGDNALIDSSTFVNNIGASGAISGGGIDGELTIINSTFANNQGIGGGFNPAGAGAIEDQTGLNHFTIINSTIASNTAANSGGGIDMDSNTCGCPDDPGSVTLVNTIVANNSAPAGPDCSGTITSNGNNLFGTVAGCNVTTQATDIVGDPQLLALTSDTMTGQSYFPLSSTSPAIDAGNNTSCPAVDQIGGIRPIDGDGDSSADCDIGAYEQAAAVQADVCPSGCAFTTIQAAVNAASHLDTITVGPGIYPESVAIDKPLTLQGIAGAANTIVDATGLGQSVFTISADTTVDGFTVTGGQATNGAGLNITGGELPSGLILRNSIVKNNAASGGGGGIYKSYSYASLIVEDSIFEANTAGNRGGAIYFSGYDTHIINRNVFKNNSAVYHGGAILAGSAGTVKNNLFIDNDKTLYFWSYANTTVVNNTIVGSTGYAARKMPYGSMYMRNGILWDNEANLLGWGWSTQNSLIDVDPLFADEANGDYRVQAASPAIDTGMDTSVFGVVADFDSVARPQDGDGLGAGGTGDGSDYDIGAFELAP